MHTIAPIPNLNGSKAEVLIDHMCLVNQKLEEAAALMRQYQPHGRDYQIGGDYAADRAEFQRRLRMVEELAEQYYREAIRVRRVADGERVGT